MRFCDQCFQRDGAISFSLLEIIVIVGLLSLMSVTVVSSYRGFALANDLNTSVNFLVQSLQQAQNFAQLGKLNDDWSVRIDTERITLFKGSDFIARDPVLDTYFNIPASIVPSGLNQVIFTKIIGFPQNIGSILFTNTFTQESRTVSINEKGAVNY